MKKYVFITLVIFIFGFFTLFMIFDEEEKLINEVRVLVDLSNEEIIDRDYIMTGDYLIIEEAIREYIREFNNSNDKIDKAISGSSIEGVLSYENYVINGPDFTYNIDLLNSNLSIVEEEVNKLILMLDTRESNLYLDKDVSDELNDLYNKLIVEEVLGIDKESYLENISLESGSFNTLVNNCIIVLNFLRDNSSNWQLADEEIQFYNDDLFIKYNNLLEDVK